MERRLPGPFRSSPRARGAWPASSEAAFESAVAKSSDDDASGEDGDDAHLRRRSDDDGGPTSVLSILSG